MNKHLSIPVLIIIILIHSIGVIYSQTEQYKFRHLTTEDGLSHHEVTCILKESRGFMWFGTLNGLNRYDGYNFKVYRHLSNDTTSLSDDRVISLLEDTNGNLLVGTITGGLNRLDVETEKFTCYKNDPENPNSLSHDRVNTIYRDSENITWIGTNNGLNKFYPDTEAFSVFKIIPDNKEDLRNQARSLFCDNSGQLWVGTNNGLFQFDPLSKKFQPIELIEELNTRLSPYIIESICEYPHGIIWIGTNWGLFRYDNENIACSGPNSLNFKWAIKDILFPFHNNQPEAWISTQWGLYQYDPLTKKHTVFYSDPKNTESLSNHATSDMYYDENGLLWVITYRSGVDILDLKESPFKQHYIQTQTFQAAARSFYEDSDGNLWIGAHTYGLMYFDKNLNLIKRYRSKFSDNTEWPGGRVNLIYEDSDKTLWIGFVNPNPGLFIFNRQEEIFHPVLTDPSNKDTILKNLYNTYIYDIVEDNNRTKWIGTSSGLYQVLGENNRNAIIYYTNQHESSLGPVWDLFSDDSDNVWGASSDGLFSLKTDQTNSILIEKYTYFDDGSNNSDVTPRCVLKSQAGQVWVGTTHNLCLVSENEKTYRPVKGNEALINSNYIYSIVEDSSNYLWMSTRKGLVRYDPDQKADNATKLFDLSDGLPYIKNSRTILYQNKIGRIFVPSEYGTHNGFYSFDPADVKDNNNIPPIVIVDFNVRNETFKLDSSITSIKNIQLKHNQNYFSFEFTALDYLNSQKNKYAYMLEGIDKEWIYSDNRRLANYTAVPPGNYSFRVRGSNNDGYWNEEGAKVIVSILPPPWRTWWAYLLYLIFIISILIIVIRFYLRRQRLLHQLDIEHIEAEKLKELDSMKSHFFANISHEFRTPLTLILGPLAKHHPKINNNDLKQDLNMMRRNALRLQNLINQLLSLAKLESGKMKLETREENVVALVNGYVQSFESLARQKKIDLAFKSDEEIIKLFVDRDKIEKILFNLLSNAFKFTGEGGRIEVAVHGQQSAAGSPQSAVHSRQPRLKTGDLQRIQITISDTGHGIPPDKLDHIFDRFYQADDFYSKDQEGTGIGLALTKQLVEIHHGRITVESELGQGTIFYVNLPIGSEHLKGEEIVESPEPEKKEAQFIEPTNEELLINDDNSLTKEANPLLLIVEDNDDLRSYVRSSLTDKYRISEASDGVMGLEKAIEDIPDLIISDVMMPKMDGLKLCYRLKTDERTSHIPIILLTARAGKESKIEGLETGADDFITKPFDLEELQARINNLIQQRKKLKSIFLKNIGSISDISDSGITSMDKKFIKKAIQIVKQHMYDSDFSVEEFGSKAGMSRSQLHRKLKALVNQSASDFIRTIRLNTAAELLANKTGNVAEIAFEVGFNNLSWFSKCFHQQFGILPSEYSNHIKRS